MENVDIARVFDEVADLLEILQENPFRVRAYRNAARTLETVGVSIAQMAKTAPAELTELPGIGEDLAGKVVEIVETGTLPLFKDLAARVPTGLIDMMRVTNVGPKRAKLFYDKLAITSVAQLQQAASEGKLRVLPRVGEKLEQQILKACREQQARTGRARLDEADAYARPYLEYMRASPLVRAADMAGSLRRRRETIGDLDMLVASKEPAKVAERFVTYPEIASVVAHGETKCTVVLRSGVQVDLRIVEPETWGAALVYFTGSKAHNIALRTRALRRKLKISEYGVFRGDARVAGDTEESVYRALSLPWVAPELREDRGELDAAAAHELPELVELADIKGDLHVHTSDSDGASSLGEMVAAARARGYEYLAITDHSPAARIAGGMDAAGFRKQARSIERLRASAGAMTVLRGAEVDILADGRLDLDDELLGELDVVVAAVHSKLDMTEAEMTERVLRAIRDPRVTILAHPTGRLIGRREPCTIDLQRVVREARDLGVMLELNAHPERLDLNDVHVRMARDAGALLVVSTDAHRTSELDSMRYGVDQARRGWCTARDVANTRTLGQLRRVLRARTPRREPSKSLVHHGHAQRP